MNSARLSDPELRAEGWKALVDRLGPAGALRFAMQTERGNGDYSETRHRLLGDKSVTELVDGMRAAQRSRPPGKRRR